MKILVEEQDIAPVRIFLEHSGAPKDGTPTVGVLQEDMCEATSELLGNLI